MGYAGGWLNVNLGFVAKAQERRGEMRSQVQMWGTCYAIWLAPACSPIILSSHQSGRCARDALAVQMCHIVPFLPFLATRAPAPHHSTTWRWKGRWPFLAVASWLRGVTLKSFLNFSPEIKEEILEVFLARLVALHFTLVSKQASEWVGRVSILA